MAKIVLIEQFHLNVFVPRTLPAEACVAIRRTLRSVRFQADLRRAVRAVVAKPPSLTKVRVTVTC